MIEESVKYWFPLRIRHSSNEKLAEMGEKLEKEATVDEIYIPTTFQKTSATSMDFGPMFSNILFVRTTLESLRRLKSQREKYERIRYLMHHDYDENFNTHPEIVKVSDKKMEDIKTIISHANEQVVFLNNMNFACKPGQHVQITQGPFAGVVGVVKSYKKHLCVVVPIEDIGAEAVTSIPKKHLVYLADSR